MAAEERATRRARFVGRSRRGRAMASGVLVAAGMGTACAQEADPADVAVWVDRDGLVRRVRFGFHHDDVAPALGQDGDAAAATRPTLSVDVDYTVDLFDYGDESIVIEFPADAAADVTDAFREMLETMDRALLPAGET